MVGPFSPRSAERLAAPALHQLWEVLGRPILELLMDTAVSAVLLNPDGSVWVEGQRHGRHPTALVVPTSRAQQIVQGIAALAGTRLHSGTPVLSVELGVLQARFIGVVPPLVRAPSFAIHKLIACTRTLGDYVRDGLLSPSQATQLRDCIVARRNILIGGGVRSGKTTLANALLGVMAEQQHRVLVLERAPQMRCVGPHLIPLLAFSPSISLLALLQTALRWQPDRLVVGDLEGPELPTLLHAWKNLCPGGLATTTAGSLRSTLVRLEEVLQQLQVPAPRVQIARAVHVVVHLAGQGATRRITGLASVRGANGRGYRLTPLP